MKLFLVLASLSTALLLSACATTNDQNNDTQYSNIQANPTGTPSPLNTSANPWTNVNPQITGAAVAGRP